MANHAALTVADMLSSAHTINLGFIPLLGQGKPLPSDFPFSGEWLLENQMFLYRPEVPQRSGESEIVVLSDEPDNSCFGFNSVALACQLGVGRQRIFRHNRKGSLYLVRTLIVPPQFGGNAAKAYIFQIGTRQCSITIERLVDGGRA